MHSVSRIRAAPIDILPPRASLSGVANSLQYDFDAQYEGTVCGIDEAGRGPWAGPVVAAAVIWPDGLTIANALNDSKKLSKARREMLFEMIREHADVGIGLASREEIDTLNILQATKLAMQRALEAMQAPVDVALVDGNQPPALACRVVPVIKGDSLSPSIAAASIMAKVTRDRLMAEIGELFPEYGFEKHAGYGTRQHQQALARYGVTEHHRQSFAPIRQLMQEAAS